MTQNEENFINKINELQDIIDHQKKVIAESDKRLKRSQKWGRAQRDHAHKYYKELQNLKQTTI